MKGKVCVQNRLKKFSILEIKQKGEFLLPIS